MDYHDGKYGVNTDPQRGADTFIPFKSGDFILNKGEMYLDGEIVKIKTGTTNTVQLGYTSHKNGWTIFVPDDNMTSFTVSSNNRVYRGTVIYKDGTYDYNGQSSQFASATISINHAKEVLLCIAIPMSATGNSSNGGSITFNY